MPRKVRVTTTSFSAQAPPATASRNREFARTCLRAAGAERADLVCLPETFPEIGLPAPERPLVESLDGPTITLLSALAREHRVWIVAPMSLRTAAGSIENAAVVLDRDGHVAGSYAKVHPTIGECREREIVPGSRPAVIDTDFGRLGLAICYDIGWPALWEELKRQGAELVVWPSAYDGGFPLRAYAWLHRYYVVSSVYTEHSCIIDLSGRVLAATSRWHRFASVTIDLEKEIFHIDDHVAKLAQVQLDFGHRVEVHAFTEEHVFTLESHDPDWPVARIKAAYGLESFADYHRRAEGIQDQARMGMATLAGPLTG